MLRISLAFLSVALLLASSARAQMRGGGGGTGAMAMSGMGAQLRLGLEYRRRRVSLAYGGRRSIAAGFGTNPAAVYYGMGSTLSARRPARGTAPRPAPPRPSMVWAGTALWPGRSVCTGQQRLRKHRCRPRGDERHERRLIFLLRE